MKIFNKLVLIIILLISAAGCAKSDTAVNSSVNTTIDANTIVLAAGRHLAPGVKDAYYCSKTLGVWEPLITQDERGLPKPALAESWQMLDGGKVWIFKLRQGVTFHDGSRFDADAVLKNFERMEKGIKRSIFYGLDIKNFYPSLLSYEKMDDYTVKLTFAEANVNQLYKMMDFGSPIFAPGCLGEDGNFSKAAIGTGPFMIVENVLNKHVRLQRYDNYYGHKAGVASIMVRNIPSADVRYSALKSGEIVGVLDINAIPPFLADEIKKDPDFAVITGKSGMMRFLALNGTKFPFNDVRMRQAVSLAIDRQTFVESLYLNYARPTSNILSYASPYHRDFPVEYDLQRAKKLARSVIGDKRYAVTYCINGSDTMQKGEAELIAYWLQDIGLDVTIQSLEYATLVHTVRKGEYHIARMQQGLANGDPYAIFYTFMMPRGGRNISTSLGYANPEVAVLLERAKHTMDEQIRSNLYARIQEISIEEQPVVVLFNDLSIVAYNNKRIKPYKLLTYGIDIATLELVD